MIWSAPWLCLRQLWVLDTSLWHQCHHFHLWEITSLTGLRIIFCFFLFHIYQGFIQAVTDLHLPEVKTILNWVLKLIPWKQKIKSYKNCLKSNKNLEKALFVILLFNFRCHQRCKKSVQKEKLHSREQNVCPRQTSFLPYFFWINLLHQFSK